MPARAPAFQFYPRDFASDGRVEAMTTEEVGAYTLILCKAWFEDPPGSIPNDEKVLASWARVPLRRWRKIAAKVLAPFRLGPDGRLHQKRMIEVAAEQEANRERMEQRAKKAAAARWKDGVQEQPPSNALALLEESSASASASASATNNGRDKAVSNETGEPPNGSQPPPKQETWTDGELMALIRKRFYIPDGKPPTHYEEGREFSIFKALRKLGRSGSDIAAAIEGVAAIRDASGWVDEDTKVDWIEAGDKLTMRCLFNTKTGLLPLWTVAIQKHNQVNKRSGTALGSSTAVGAILRSAIGAS